MSLIQMLKAGFSLGVPASREIIDEIRQGVVVHRTFNKHLTKMITGVIRRPDGFSNCHLKMTGDFGVGPFDLVRATVRDYRIVDFGLFQGKADRGFTDFVYFFLGEPEAWQVEAQNYGGSGEVATVRVQGGDLLADSCRKIFYRRGLFWEGDRAVIVKGGYQGPAQVQPLPSDLKVPFV
jgi:hypothetical protein